MRLFFEHSPQNPTHTGRLASPEVIDESGGVGMILASDKSHCETKAFAVGFGRLGQLVQCSKSRFCPNVDADVCADQLLAIHCFIGGWQQAGGSRQLYFHWQWYLHLDQCRDDLGAR